MLKDFASVALSKRECYKRDVVGKILEPEIRSMIDARNFGALRDVFDWAKLAYPKESNFIALGDYNAACSYATPAQLDALSIRRSDYFWIVPDDSDSNVSPTSACAYDRIVVTAATKRSFTGRSAASSAGAVSTRCTYSVSFLQQ